MATVASSISTPRPRRVARVRAAARRVATRVAAAPQVIIERVRSSGAGRAARRVYSGARGGIARARGVARLAASRAQGVLSGGTGRLLTIGVTVAAMVLLLPVMRSVFRLTGRPNAGFILAGIFLALAFIFLRFLKKPGLAIGAIAVAGFIAGSQALERWGSGMAPQPVQANASPPQQLGAPQGQQPGGAPALPDRAQAGRQNPANRGAPVAAA